MTSKLGGRLALVFAAGAIAFFGGPLHAAPKSSAADARAAQTSWLGDTLSASDIINRKPIAGTKVTSANGNLTIRSNGWLQCQPFATDVKCGD